jgi:hypothetical protein
MPEPRCNLYGMGALGLGYVRVATPADMPVKDPTRTFRNIRLTPMPFYDAAKRRPWAPWRA